MTRNDREPKGEAGLRALEELASKAPPPAPRIPRTALVVVVVAVLAGAGALWIAKSRTAGGAIGLRPPPETVVLELLNARTTELEQLVDASKRAAADLTSRGQLGHEVCSSRESLASYADSAQRYLAAVKAARAKLESSIAEVEAAREGALVDPATMQREGGVLYRMLLAPEFLEVGTEEEQGVAELVGLTGLLLEHWGEWEWPRTSAGPEFNGDDAELVRGEFVTRTKRMVDAFRRQSMAQAALQKRIAEWRAGGNQPVRNP